MFHLTPKRIRASTHLTQKVNGVSDLEELAIRLCIQFQRIWVVVVGDVTKGLSKCVLEGLGGAVTVAKRFEGEIHLVWAGGREGVGEVVGNLIRLAGGVEENIGDDIESSDESNQERVLVSLGMFNPSVARLILQKFSIRDLFTMSVSALHVELGPYMNPLAIVRFHEIRLAFSFVCLFFLTGALLKDFFYHCVNSPLQSNAQ
ncbi:hypothetical protein BC829DRAFT_286499 [Chytridium lagenaria]|nr:hypothetical protein BC829DRAFT_286499 [Chytridium lagenaria]